MTNATMQARSVRPSFSGEGEGFGLAQRLLVANEDAVFNISDLWVAAATASRDDDQYSQVEYEDSVFDEDEELENALDAADRSGSRSRDQSATPSVDDLRGAAAKQSMASGASPVSTPNKRAGLRTSFLQVTPEQSASKRRESAANRRFSINTNRRISTASGRLPAIFANTGLSDPLPVMSPSREQPPLSVTAGSNAANLSLAPIIEGKQSKPNASTPLRESAEPFPPVSEKPTANWGDLPLGLIFQYFCLALHGTACDQIFMWEKVVSFLD